MLSERIAQIRKLRQMAGLYRSLGLHDEADRNDARAAALSRFAYRKEPTP